jgi:hypothetical protein
LAESLHELANAARLGVILITPETEAQLMGACTTIEKMRADLVAALGLKVNP